MQPLEIMVLDTETASLHGDIYDIAYTICNKRGEISLERNWLVKEIFTDSKRMMGAFFAGKIFTHYAPMLRDGEIEMWNWLDIVNVIRQDIAEHNVNVIAAYNLAFDRKVMASTHVEFGDNFPILHPMKQLDIWRFCVMSKLNTRLYKDIAKEKGWMSEAGNFKTTAEHAYRYISTNHDFEESHTALDDARIETQILASCFKQHGKIPYNVVNSHAWRILNNV